MGLEVMYVSKHVYSRSKRVVFLLHPQFGKLLKQFVVESLVREMEAAKWVIADDLQRL